MESDAVRLAGAHCVLRDWRAADLPGYAVWLRPHHAWHDTSAPYLGRPTEAEIRGGVHRLEMLAAQPAAQRPVPRATLAITDPSTGTAFGFVSWAWESKPTNWRRMGIVVFDPAWWGRGVGTQALAMWTTYLFDTTDARR